MRTNIYPKTDKSSAVLTWYYSRMFFKINQLLDVCDLCLEQMYLTSPSLSLMFYQNRMTCLVFKLISALMILKGRLVASLLIESISKFQRYCSSMF